MKQFFSLHKPNLICSTDIDLQEVQDASYEREWKILETVKVM
jgi:hypothetical protein